ncbi:MAG: hypothetical protein JWP55_1687 [Mycobacterium sp.]|nr:hypothetical protein [Mycobacterium sp.]
MTAAHDTFAELTARDGKIPEADLDALWSTLKPATVDFMIGDWQGGAFDTGHRLVNSLEEARWFGKTFTSPDDVKPLICLDEDGNKFSNVELGKGEATLWVQEFRGELVATMVYDGQPLHDHFKVVDDDTVMGIMNGKHALRTGSYGYFYLRRV